MQTADQQQWLPRDEKNPFRVWSMKTNEEWKEISRWYEFSIRMLGTFKPEWHEVARTASWEDAKDIINTLGKAKKDKLYVVIKCTLVGKEGREKPVLWYPSEGSVREAMKQEVSNMDGGVGG